MQKQPPRFVAKLMLRGGALWLSSRRGCARARGTIRRLLRDGDLTEENLCLLPPGYVLSLTRPEADCPELHVDFEQGIVMDVQVKRDFPGALREEIVNRQFLDDFVEGLERVFSDTTNEGDVEP